LAEGDLVIASETKQSHLKSYRERDCHALRARNDNVKTFIAFLIVTEKKRIKGLAAFFQLGVRRSKQDEQTQKPKLKISLRFFNTPDRQFYIVIENANKRLPTEEEIKRDQQRKIKPQDRAIGGEVYRSDDGGKTWKKMNSAKGNIGGRPGYYYGQIRIDPNNDKVIYVLSVFLVQRVIRRRSNLSGHRHFTASNEPNGIAINYYLKNKLKDSVKITITDPYGKELNRLKGKQVAGMNRVIWNMRQRPTKEEIQARQQRFRRSREPAGKLVPPGEYMIILKAGDKKLTRKVRIRR